MECLTGKVENMQWGHSRRVKPTVMCCLCLLSLIIWVESGTPLTETVISSCYRNKIVWTARAGECLGLTVITQCWTMNLSNEDMEKDCWCGSRSGRIADGRRNHYTKSELDSLLGWKERQSPWNLSKVVGTNSGISKIFFKSSSWHPPHRSSHPTMIWDSGFFREALQGV